MKDYIIQRLRSPDRRERGQILAILALAMVGLLVAAGLAVDGGMLFLRKGQLDRATDAAALAGVAKLSESDSLSEANVRGLQLLAANDIAIPESDAVFPCSSVNWATDNYCGSKSLGNAPGSIRYLVEVQWESQTYFLPLIGIGTIPIRAQATAEYLPNVDLFASDTAEIGVIKASTEEIFGPDQCCHVKGDPYTPTTSPYWSELEGVYTFRVRIPQSYYDNFDDLRVEIFDPDTGNTATQTHVVYGLNGGTANTQTTCGSSQLNPCLLDTDTTTANVDQANPFWYVRVDEHREDDGNYTDTDNTATLYRLYYLEQNNDGSLTEVDLAYYIGKADGAALASPTGAYSAAEAQTEAVATDRHWVAPGAPAGERMPAFNMESVFYGIAAWAGDTSYMTGESGGEPVTYTEVCETYRVNHDGAGDPADATVSAGLLAKLGGVMHFTDAPRCEGDGNFIIGLKGSSAYGDEVPNIYVDPTSGVRDLFLDVRGISGKSENGYYFWVGPPRTADGSDDMYTVPSFINARQNYMLLRQGAGNTVHSSEGAVAYGLGHLPMNSNINFRTELPLAYLGPEFAGQQISIGYFDPDSGASNPIGFSFDTIPKDDWMACFDDDAGGANCGAVGGTAADRVGPSGIPDGSGNWLEYTFTVPSDGGTPSIPFYGGRLIVSYQGGQDDTYGIRITIESRPYLVQ